MLELNWLGPIRNTWNDNECRNVKTLGKSYNAHGCKSACAKDPACTAFNYYNDRKNPGGCTLRACDFPVTYPSSQNNNFVGYYLAKGIV